MKLERLFVVVGGFFLLTVCVFFHLLNSEKNIAIHFAEKEIQGNLYLRPLRQLLEDLHLHRVSAYARSIDQPDQKGPVEEVSPEEKNIDDTLRVLATVDAPLTASFETGNMVQELEAQWSGLKNTLAGLSAAQINQEHIRLFSQVRKLITHVGDHSNLILDPDLDSYYAMDAVLLKLPEAQNLLFQLTLLLQEAASKSSFSLDDKMQLISLAGNLRLNLEGLNSGVLTAFKNNNLGNLKPALEKPLRMYAQYIEKLLKHCDGTLAAEEDFLTKAQEISALTEKSYEASFELWDRSVQELDRLLRVRISGFEERKMFALVTVIFMALFTFLFGILIFRIIAKRKKTEAELRVSEERFRAISEASPLGIYVTNPEGDCVYTNHTYQSISGLTLEDAAGKGWSRGIHPEDRDRVFQEWYEFTKDPTTFESEHRFLRKDGSVVWASVKSAPIRDGETILGYVGTVEDTTAKKRLEEQLLQSQKMETVGSLAGGIAHDLNNHLSPLSGYLDLILKELQPSDPNLPLMQEANLAAHRCAEVAQRLLNFSRSSSLKKTNISVQKLLKELEGLLHNFLPSTIQIKILSDDGLHPVYGNETELQTVLMNLATNARDAMPEGGSFTVEAHNVQLGATLVKSGFAPGDYVLIRTRDSGKGIPAEIIGKIFDPFFTTKTKGRGTGLGLAMVFSNIKDHQGWIEVSSEVGRGTEFSIYLPAHHDEEGLGRESEEVLKQLPRGNETVLLVDDEESLRRMGKTFLDRLGYKVLSASDGEEAARIYAERRDEISVIVMDMTMPKLTGRQTLQKILKIDPKARVVLASGYTAEGSIQQLLSEGASAFITKPYNISSLAKTLREVLDRSK